MTYMGTTWDKNIACCCHLAGHFLKTCFIDGLAFPSEGALLFDMTLHHMSFTSITRFRTPHPRCFPRRIGGFTDDMSGWIQDHDQMLSACLLAGFRHDSQNASPCNVAPATILERKEYERLFIFPLHLGHASGVH